MYYRSFKSLPVTLLRVLIRVDPRTVNSVFQGRCSFVFACNNENNNLTFSASDTYCMPHLIMTTPIAVVIENMIISQGACNMLEFDIYLELLHEELA